MNYEVISTGSKGNCVVINDVMVDCGVPFMKIRDKLYSIKYLLITHTHSDHLNIKTLEGIATLFPRITIIGNYEVNHFWMCNKIANAGFPIETDDYFFTPFECVHDVLCYGYTWSYEGQEIIYATDTSTLEFAPKKKYDWLFLESNHDEEKLEAARNMTKGSYNPYLSGKRHLSTQQAKIFYYMNRKNQGSQLIELHQSVRFY
jgi:L-ascorbate metabolism protein UlaG (beta-lactamase superfamily)